MNNFFVKRFLDPLSSTAGSFLGAAAPEISAGLGVIQAGIGIAQTISANKKIKGLMAQREANPYTIPDSVSKAFNLVSSYAGGDTITRNFETNQIDNSFASSEATATKLGADPNDLSAMFGAKIQGLIQVGDQFHKSNTDAVSALLNQYKTNADYTDAVWKSKDDLLRDKLAAAGAKLTTGTQNISGGINTTLGSISAKATAGLYKPTDWNSLLKDFMSKQTDATFASQVKNDVSGGVTGQDMNNSMVSNNNNNSTA